ncbi:MAG: hypothetical protein Q4B67_05265 [Eubacteriales bacterium]|nr:hypothetical protein [Eubacteriales bacterium]
MKRFDRVLITAIVLTFAISLVSFATGWEQNENGWRWIDSNGTPIYNEWKPDSNGDYFYLDGNGYMAKETFVDNERYVDASGRMVKNRWMQHENKWYYFDQSGKMVTNKKRLIEDQWYFFDYDGTMITGWHSDGDDWYYCNGEAGGHLITNAWKKLEPAEGMIFDQTNNVSDEGVYWFYFQSTGKAARATDTDYKEFAIAGEKYAFDRSGRMVTGWTKLADTTPVIAGYKYYNDTSSIGTYGAAHTGWLSAYAPDGTENGGEVQWYYFDTKGVPVYGKKTTSNNGATAYEANFKKITKNGTTYTYLFNDLGNPVYGLVQVKGTDGAFTSMYFGTKTQSCLQKGASTIVEGDGTTWKYHFTSAGYGYTGIYNNCLYYKGKLQKALDDSSAYYTVNGTTYLVTQAGALRKSYNKTKKANEVEYRSDSSGIRDGGTAGVSPLIEPEWTVQE